MPNCVSVAIIPHLNLIRAGTSTKLTWDTRLGGVKDHLLEETVDVVYQVVVPQMLIEHANALKGFKVGDKFRVKFIESLDRKSNVDC